MIILDNKIDIDDIMTLQIENIKINSDFDFNNSLVWIIKNTDIIQDKINIVLLMDISQAVQPL